MAKRLVALAHIQHGYIRYKPGDTLPAADMALALEWLAAGTAKLVDDDGGKRAVLDLIVDEDSTVLTDETEQMLVNQQSVSIRPAFLKAKQASALPGLSGTAVGGEQTGDDLVGRVPLTKERMIR